MPELLLDLLLPETDRGVALQWLIMVPFWLIVLVVTRRQPRDIRMFIAGLAMLNLAWFGARTIH